MGLDMYLYLRKSESCGRWDNDYEQKKVGFYPEELKDFAEEISKENFMSKETMYQVGYWRKENAIHKWFVDNCADGVDECQQIYVSVEKAKELRNLCNRVLENHELAKELLPTQGGFFFGGLEYDEWYFSGLKYTKELLDKVIEFVDTQDNYDIFYQASW